MRARRKTFTNRSFYLFFKLIHMDRSVTLGYGDIVYGLENAAEIFCQK